MGAADIGVPQEVNTTQDIEGATPTTLAQDTADTFATPDSSLEPQTQLDSDQAEQPDPEDPQAPAAVPFANGKEKFKVNGVEYEWDWETTKRYAQIGRAGHVALERAAETEKKAKDAYQKLYRAAQEDPDGLIRILRNEPTWQPGTPRTARGQNPQLPVGAGEAQQAEEVDPREAEIQELRQKLERFEQNIEAAEIAKERQAFQQELEESCKKYPALNNNIHREYVKSLYRKQLNAGNTEITVEDVAFHVDQELKDLRAQEMKSKQKKLDEKRRRAPVTNVPGQDGGSPAARSFEELRRQIGRA